MRILQMAISESYNESAQLEMAARELIKNPGAVINAIGRVGRNWARVMDNIKDWVESVSSRRMCILTNWCLLSCPRPSSLD